MKKRLFTALIYFLCTITIFSCQSANENASTSSNSLTTDDFACLSGEIKFSYPIGETSISPTEQRLSLPGFPWKKSATYESDNENLIPYSLLLQKEVTGDIFWVNFGADGGIVFYNLELRKWEQYIEPTSGIQYLDFFIDKNNELWAYRHAFHAGPNLVYRLNKNNKQFEPVIDQSGLLLDQNSEHAIYNLQVDGDGVFWMNEYNYSDNNFSLVSYNPFTNKAEIHLTDLKIYDQLALSVNDDVFVYASQNNSVIVYNPKTKQYKNLIIPQKSNMEGPVTLFFDKENRLWVDNAGYFDLSKNIDNPQWYQIVRPSMFLVYIDAAGLWTWSTPKYTFESPNGLLWYYTGNGTGWVDPSEGKWCIFTSFNSSIQEDSLGNLWMFVDNKLYRLDNRYSKLFNPPSSEDGFD